METLTTYKKRLPIETLTLKHVPDDEKFNVIPNRLFYYLAPHKGKEVWIRTGQGNYNWMRSQGYYVSYIDNAIVDETEF